ncbi:MAG: cardiolipin synthase, partial [Bacteroidales bacterium]|nr:cardiolipin synthase [Bacteroidales bacterium]
MKKYKLFDDNLVLFNSILNDIKNAKQSIWIEIYRFGKDAMGERFRMALETKVKEGIEVKLLVD